MANQSQKIFVVGIGEDGLAGLTDYARRLIESADLVVGEQHCLDLVGEIAGQRISVSSNLEEIVETITANRDKRIVILALGDPLFYGTAHYLWDKIGKEYFEIVPHVSIMQMAFARVKESWEDALLVNLAHISLEDLFNQIRGAETVGMFTTDELPPNVIAQRLLATGLNYFTAYVCENLGAPNERVTTGDLETIAQHTYSPMNVLILVRKPDVPDRPLTLFGKRVFGNPDEAFLQSKPKRGLLTPREIRSIVLAELDVGPSSIVWDVGAGSGAVSVEAAQLARDGHVYAIEMDPEDVRLIQENARRFEVTNLTSVLGHAPEAWEGLPDPDCIFIGGSGRQIVGLCEAAYARLRRRGRIVLTMGSLENIVDVHSFLRQHTNCLNVLMVNLARGFYQFDRVRFQSLNPTFVVSAVKVRANAMRAE
ncbi:MAG: precorrin-6y C5,15-methyltransferase (decarboxylating) subunit CbiE [Thermogutta sp.]